MKVLIADKLPSFTICQLKSLGCEVLNRVGLSGTELTEAVREEGCEALIVRSTKVPRETLMAGDRLKLVIRAGSGFDTIDIATANEREIRVCNCPGMNAVAVAELTLGMMIALDRQIVDETADLRRGIWNKKRYAGHAMGLMGRTLGIVGMGNVGQAVARRAAAFGMGILYVDVVRRQDFEREVNLRKVPFDALLLESDFITLHVPGGGQTHHMIGRRELGLMKPTAYLINCSRGGVVDEVALADALENGEIAGAASDVFEIEPTAEGKEFLDPIAKQPQFYGTHHVGASTIQAQEAVAEEALKIVQDFIEYGEYRHCVNPPQPQAAV